MLRGGGEDSPFVVFVLQGVDDGGGDLLHQVVRLPGVQQAREAPHVARPHGPTLLLCLLEPAAALSLKTQRPYSLPSIVDPPPPPRDLGTLHAEISLFNSLRFGHGKPTTSLTKLVDKPLHVGSTPNSGLGENVHHFAYASLRFTPLQAWGAIPKMPSTNGKRPFSSGAEIDLVVVY